MPATGVNIRDCESQVHVGSRNHAGDRVEAVVGIITARYPDAVDGWIEIEADFPQVGC